MRDPLRVCLYTAQQIVITWSLRWASMCAVTFTGCNTLIEYNFDASPSPSYHSSAAFMGGHTASQAALCCANVLACWKAGLYLVCCAAVCAQAGSLPTGDDRYGGLLNLRGSAQVDHRADKSDGVRLFGQSQRSESFPLSKHGRLLCICAPTS